MKMTLFVDDERRPKSKDWIRIRSGKLAIETIHDLLELNSQLELDVYLDHDLGSRITGYDVAKYIVENDLRRVKHVYVHSMNPVGANNICQLLSHYGWDVERINLNNI